MAEPDRIGPPDEPPRSAEDALGGGLIDQAVTAVGWVARFGLRTGVDVTLRLLRMPEELGRVTRPVGTAVGGASGLAGHLLRASLRTAGAAAGLARATGARVSGQPDADRTAAPGRDGEPAGWDEVPAGWGEESADWGRPSWEEEPVARAGEPEPAAAPPLPPATRRLREAVSIPGPLHEPPAADELPLAGFDQLTLGSLRARVRRLDRSELESLRDYELAHGHRAPVLTLLENRLRRLAAETDASG